MMFSKINPNITITDNVVFETDLLLSQKEYKLNDNNEVFNKIDPKHLHLVSVFNL